jgi:hypothetical protein
MAVLEPLFPAIESGMQASQMVHVGLQGFDGRNFAG